MSDRSPNPRNRLAMFPELESRAMRELLATSDRVAPADSTVLLRGETGVGKEWLARRIHAASRRSDQPFVALNCAAVPDALLESELFGHVRGAFTGAVRSRRGHFELAHGGTLFLDEIGEMAPHLQGKLLRAVQDLEIQRVGAEETVRVDVRLMAATSRNLEEGMAAGTFRSDLYYRLAVVSLRVPPLRERPDDVEPLMRYYLERFARRAGRPGLALPEPVLQAMRRHPWPGNVRELVNAVERMVVLGEGDSVRFEDLPVAVRESSADGIARAAGEEGAAVPPGLPDEWLALSLRAARQRAVERFERLYLEAVLMEEKGRIGATAHRIGVDPRSLHDKMKRYGLRKEEYR